MTAYGICVGGVKKGVACVPDKVRSSEDTQEKSLLSTIFLFYRGFPNSSDSSKFFGPERGFQVIEVILKSSDRPHGLYSTSSSDSSRS